MVEKRKSLVERTRQCLDNNKLYGLATLLGMVASVIGSIYKAEENGKVLKETAIIYNEKDSFKLSYGFDDGNNGIIDRIEISGVGLKSLFISTPYRETLREGVKFEAELDELYREGRKK